MKVSDEDLELLHDLQRQQTDNAAVLGCAIREIVFMALSPERGEEADAKVGAHALTLWDQIEKCRTKYTALGKDQDAAMRAALRNAGANPDEIGTLWRIADDGTAQRLIDGAWVEG